MIRRRFSVPKFGKEDYMTITALEDMTVCINDNYAGNYTTKYRINEGKWVQYNNSEYVSVTAQSYIQFCCEYVKLPGGLRKFDIEGKCNLSGNCLSILYGDDYRKKNYIYQDLAFSDLFKDCASIHSVSKDFLPATKLAPSCYRYMFYGCTSLTTAPELPATTLASGCYNSMFYGCSKLNYIKMLATDIPDSTCLSYWLYGVADRGTFVKNPAMTSLPTASLSNSYSGIPLTWYVVSKGFESGDTPKFPAVLLFSSQYYTCYPAIGEYLFDKYDIPVGGDATGPMVNITEEIYVEGFSLNINGKVTSISRDSVLNIIYLWTESSKSQIVVPRLVESENFMLSSVAWD